VPDPELHIGLEPLSSGKTALLREITKITSKAI